MWAFVLLWVVSHTEIILSREILSERDIDKIVLDKNIAE
jgi:hypothetical protein